jgi:hypoxanthine phosphoribosyltransferase
MPEFIPVLTKSDIRDRVSALGERISADYKGKDLVLIGVLKGAFIFLSDLIRHITVPVKIDFVGAASYGDKTETSGRIKLTKDVEIDLRDKDVLVVEDIIDSGLTLAHLVDYLKSLGLKSIKICTLVDKRERRQAAVSVDYACHVVEEGFLVGYGLDYAEDYRHLPEIYHLKL